MFSVNKLNDYNFEKILSLLPNVVVCSVLGVGIWLPVDNCVVQLLVNISNTIILSNGISTKSLTDFPNDRPPKKRIRLLLMS